MKLEFIKKLLHQMQTFVMQKMFERNLKDILNKIGNDRFESILQKNGWIKSIDGNKTIYKKDNSQFTIENL